jgi:hypothetical protein
MKGLIVYFTFKEPGIIFDKKKPTDVGFFRLLFLFIQQQLQSFYRLTQR